MQNVDTGLLPYYQRIITLTQGSPVYYRHLFCGTRNRSVYLKIVTRKGTFFTQQDLVLLDTMLRTWTPAIRYALKTNPLKGTVSIKLDYLEGVQA